VLTSGSVVDREGTGALSVLLHPLVIIHVSDHHTRVRIQQKQENPRVVGALMGVQSGRTVEILNSFELPTKTEEGILVIDTKYLTLKLEQFKKVFGAYELLGWYSTGPKVVPADMVIHKQVSEYNENPLYLQLDAAGCASSRELPIFIFESELRLVNEIPTQLFVKMNYKIETGEAERISVDHVAKISPTGTGTGSALTSHLMGVHNAIGMLNTRVKILLTFLEATKSGKIPRDQSLLRSLASLTNQLPAIDSQGFQQDFINEYNDALIVAYLAAMTKGSNSINELIDKFNVVNEKGSRRRMF